LTYSENKKYLETLVIDFDPESDMAKWEAAEEQYMTERPIENYIACTKLKPRSRVQIPSGSERFSLKDRAHVGFSLRSVVAAKVK